MPDSVTIGGIILNIVFAIFIIIVVVITFSLRDELLVCENDQSPYCLTIQCPYPENDPNNTAPPCQGYAQRPGPQPNTYYCSYAPNTLVGSDGKPIS
jgi:hypothetical protein